MAATADNIEDKIKRDIYIKRILEFIASVKSWLPKQLDVTETSDRMIKYRTEDEEYAVPMASIVKNEVVEPNDAMADLFPQGAELAKILPQAATLVLSDGFLHLHGTFSQENIVYLTPDTFKDYAGKSRFKGVKKDGWYWLSPPRHRRARLIDKEFFLELLEMVSDYESD
ncbi:MAG: hypothetical protein GY862_02835 [Gammaproteobacteria bacterium]|nr:hypothetical protein [Gammaproteobacteria bacterium]